MFSVSALLLDDAVLICVVTEVVLLVAVLLQMFSWFWQWNKFENWLKFEEIKAYKTKCASILGHSV